MNASRYCKCDVGKQRDEGTYHQKILWTLAAKRRGEGVAGNSVEPEGSLSPVHALWPSIASSVRMIPGSLSAQGCSHGAPPLARATS